jgi:kinesin family member 15
MFNNLQDELIRTKSGDTTTCKAGYFSAQNARESLHSLRVSLNRSLVLPHIEVDSEEEMEVDEDDVHELRDQISKLHSSSEDTFDDFMDAESGDDTPCSKGTLTTSEEDDIESPLQDKHKEAPDNTSANEALASDWKSSLSISSSPRLPPMEDPALCSSPKIHNKARKNITSPGLSPSKLRDRDVETCRNSAVRSSLQSSKLSPTDSLASSLQRGLHIIEYHQQNIAPHKSFVGLSFDHFTRNPRLSMAKVSSVLPQDQETVICSSCKKPVNTNENETENADSQSVVTTSVTNIESASASLKVGIVI